MHRQKFAGAVKNLMVMQPPKTNEECWRAIMVRLARNIFIIMVSFTKYIFVIMVSFTIYEVHQSRVLCGHDVPLGILIIY